MTAASHRHATLPPPDAAGLVPGDTVGERQGGAKGLLVVADLWHGC